MYPLDPVSPGAQADYRLSPNVLVLQVYDGTVRLIHLDEKYHALSQVGALILSETLAVGASGAIDRLITTYGIDRSIAETDVNQLLQELQQAEIIASVDAPFRVNQRSSPWVWQLVFRFLLQGITALPLAFKFNVWWLLALAYCSVRRCGWSKTIELWQLPIHPLSTPLSFPEITAFLHTVDQQVPHLVASHLLPVSCKERALVCWRLLRSVGIPAQLIVGIDLFPLSSHAWCEVDGKIIADNPERCAVFTPVRSYGVFEGT